MPSAKLRSLQHHDIKKVSLSDKFVIDAEFVAMLGNHRHSNSEGLADIVSRAGRQPASASAGDRQSQQPASAGPCDRSRDCGISMDGLACAL